MRTEQEIYNIARSLILDSLGDLKRISQFPIAIEKIIFNHKISLSEAEFRLPELVGFYKDQKIYIDKTQRLEDQRLIATIIFANVYLERSSFYWINKDYLKKINHGFNLPKQDLLCKIFALSLLMPPPIFVRAHWILKENLNDLSLMFGVRTSIADWYDRYIFSVDYWENDLIY